MPVKKTSASCYQFGNSGKKYCGNGAKAKAVKQGQAIKASQSKSK